MPRKKRKVEDDILLPTKEEQLDEVDEVENNTEDDDDIVHDVFDVMGNPYSYLDGNDSEASEWD